jgi:hypothetical protein
MKVSGIIPQLRTTDLGASIRFYTTQLGFALDFQYEDFYAGLRAGPSESLVKDVHDTPWGTREFVVKDDQGHTLYFGQSRG